MQLLKFKTKRTCVQAMSQVRLIIIVLRKQPLQYKFNFSGYANKEKHRKSEQYQRIFVILKNIEIINRHLILLVKM